MKTNLKKLCVSAILIALSTVLSLIKVWQMPLGGSVTLLSMVPVCMISCLYGVCYAVLPCLAYGVIQMFLGGVFSWGLTPAVLIACILLDYILAYTSTCFAGLFRHKKFGLLYGVAFAFLVRFFCHFVSGAVLFKSFDVFNNPYIYSLCYNGAYMLPEMIITCIAVFFLSKSKALKKLLY